MLAYLKLQPIGSVRIGSFALDPQLKWLPQRLFPFINCSPSSTSSLLATASFLFPLLPVNLTFFLKTKLKTPTGVLNSGDHEDMTPTRTVAIIKPHALQSRFDIEPRISQAGFEIVKERQMEFDVETDPETLYELFGDDAECFADGPVWVYVLERPRAVQVWLELMGDADPARAMQRSPQSLRALYGMSEVQNAVMGPTTDDQAELQIAALFASSPPFPSAPLPAFDDGEHSDDQVSSGVDSFALSSDVPASDVTRISSHASPKPAGRRTSSVSAGFKARPIPATTAEPDIQPRMSRAAELRKSLSTGTGADGSPHLASPPPGLVKTAPRTPITRERLAETFADVPGHGFRSQKIAVASTAAPKITPRMSRAASLRLGIPVEGSPTSKKSPGPKSVSPANSGVTPTAGTPGEEKKNTFEGVPGHKRRESFNVASTREPTMAPRLNKAAALRAEKKEAAPPSSFNFRGAAPPLSRRSSLDASNLSNASRRSVDSSTRPALSRTTSRDSSSSSRPPPASRTASLSRATAHKVSASIATSRPAQSASATGSAKQEPATVEKKTVPPPKPSSVVAPPAIAPRQNKAAMLRAAKMAGTAAAPAGGAKKAKPVSTF